MNYKAYLISAFLLLPLSASALEVRILDIHDGDTLTAVGVEDAKKYKIRLLGVDTPEIDFFKQNQGEDAEIARAVLRQLLPRGTVVKISDDSDIDRHGRVLGRLFKNSLDINKELLLQGLGYFYFIAPFNKRALMEYSEAAQIAVETRRGLFAKASEEPYLFRLRVRKQEGKNLLGDLETKKLYAPEDIQQVPVWRRVFFSDELVAKNLGYKY